MNDGMNIRFLGEAYEAFQRTLDEMTGYGVTIKLANEEPFDAVLIGADHQAEDGATVAFYRIVSDGDFPTIKEIAARNLTVERAVTEWITVF